MNWLPLSEEAQIGEIIEQSHSNYVVIFKHSTRCSISAMAKNRLERAIPVQNVLFYYLDLLRYRSVSNKVAEVFHVIHQSPQILLVKNGRCEYTESHNGIEMSGIGNFINGQMQ